MKKNHRFFVGLAGVATVVTYLIWTGVSETLNPSTVDGVIAEIVETAGKQLTKQGLLP